MEIITNSFVMKELKRPLGWEAKHLPIALNRTVDSSLDLCGISFVGVYLGMTLPIITVVRTDENRSIISHDVTIAYFLPTEHQVQPPRPTDSEILIEIWPATTVYTRSANNQKPSYCFFVTKQQCSHQCPSAAFFQGLYRCHQWSHHHWPDQHHGGAPRLSCLVR